MTNSLTCLEDNVWTPVLTNGLDENDPLVKKLRVLDPTAPISKAGDADPFTLDFAKVDAKEYGRIHDTGQLVFHVTGCTGDPVPGHEDAQDDVAKAMAGQLASGGAAFLYHLGDIAYKPDDPPSGTVETDTLTDEMLAASGKKHSAASPALTGKDQPQLYAQEFYAAYSDYKRSIFAIGGNHDGKYHLDHKGNLSLDKSAMWHFLLNFCAPAAALSPDNQDAKSKPIDPDRQTMTQPYPFWILKTPVAWIVGLYANVVNGGILDDPNGSATPQYVWLVNRLKAILASNQARKSASKLPRVVLLAVHYPPYSAAVNFAQRGDPALSQTVPPPYPNAKPLGMLLQQAFTESGQWPDVVLSAHAHLYQRLTYIRKETGQEIPYLIAGSGGHIPVEKMGADCSGTTFDKPPFPPVFPSGLTIGADTLRLDAFNDSANGFLRLTVTSALVQGEFFTATGGTPVLADSFTLHLGSPANHLA